MRSTVIVAEIRRPGSGDGLATRYEIVSVMRIVELSNHPGEMLDQRQDRRALAERERRQAHQRKVAQHHARVAHAREARQMARTARSWWTWVRGAYAVWKLEGEAPRRPVPVRADVHGEARLTAGISGEQKVARRLGEALGEEWLLVRGYRNRGGEIDQLLVGPTGVVAIEVKHRNATVHCDGDRWWFEKFDRYGKVKKDGWMTDDRGRSPSEQLCAPMRELQGFLSRRGHPVEITPVVVLTHPRSRLGSLQNLTVDVSTRPDYVLELIGGKPRVMDGERCQALERLIVQDHAFHEQRQHRPRSPR